MSSRALPSEYAASRTELHRVATHVVARARHGATGRFGLRPTAGGFGTTAYGPENEVVRVSGDLLVVDRAGPAGSSTRAMRITGATLHELAAFVGIEIDSGFSVGDDTPEIGDPNVALRVDPAAGVAAGAWLALTMRAIDEVFAGLGPQAAPSSLQLWPEHFDLGGDALVGSGRVNLGGSLGDASHQSPYLYVGPWDDRRPGDSAIWNAPFGARAGHDEITGAIDPVAAAVEWFTRATSALAES